MKTVLMIFGIGVLVLLMIPIVFIGYGYVTFKDESYTTGEAYGFVIGETHAQVFKQAKELQSQDEIKEIHRWPPETYHFEFSDQELKKASKDETWTMVVNPEWWNDTIRLEFNEGKSSGIYRFRLCCELP